MSQKATDIVIANANGAAVRTDANNVIEDVETWHAGASAPGTPVAHHKHHDTDTGYLHVRNAANNAWVETVFNATTGLIGLAGIRQVVQNTISATGSYNGLDTGWQTVANYDVDITPHNTSSRILILMRFNAAAETAPGAFRLLRDSTAICIPPPSGTKTQATGMIPLVGTDTNEEKANYAISGIYVDSPATTSAITYGMQIKAMAGSGEYVFFNRGPNWDDEKETIMTLSQMIAVEIAG